MQGGGPGVNRTRTYGFGGHRPIHWTTGPFALSGGRKPYPADPCLARPSFDKYDDPLIPPSGFQIVQGTPDGQFRPVPDQAEIV